MKKVTLIIVLFTLLGGVYGQQKIGNNPTSLNANAVLELESTNKGLLIPRLALTSTSSASPLSAFVAGMLVYNTATAGDVTPGFYVSNGTIWSKIDNQTASTFYSGDGTLSGNRTVTQGTNTLAFTSTATTGTSQFTVDGTTLNVDAVNNRVGVGIATPTFPLHVASSGANAGRFEMNSNNSTVGGISTIELINTNNLIGNYTSIAGKASSGGFSASMEFVNTNGSHLSPIGDIRFVTNNNGTITEKLRILGSGGIRASSLAGSGSRMVVADASGNLNTQTIPTSTTYTGSTSVTLNGTSFERAALTGDVTSAANSNSTTIATDAVTSAKILNGTIAEADVANDAVSYAKLQNVSTNNRLLGRGTTGAGDAEEITIGSGLTLTGTTLTATGGSTLYSADGTLAGNRTVTQGTNTLAFTSSATNGFSVDGSTFSVDAANNRVGIGTTSPRGALDVGGTTGWTYLQNSSYGIGNPTIARGLMYAWNNTGSNGEHELLFGTGEGSAPSFNISTWNGTTKTPRFVITKDGDFSLDGSTLSLDATNNRVGIGTASPTQTLDVNGTILARFGGTAGQTTGNEQLLFGYAGTANYRHAIRTRHNDGNVAGNAIDFYTWSNADAVGGLPSLLNLSMNGGNIGIGTGTATPSSRLEVAGGKIKIDASQTLTIAPTDNFSYDSKSMSHYGIGWFNDTWNGGGSTAWLSGYGGVKLFGGGSLLASFHQYGTCSNTSGSWSAFSDMRIKTVKSEFKDGLDVIKQINPVRFVYNENAPFKSKDVQIGIVAQDLEKVAPYMVTKTNDGEIQDLREVNSQAYVFLLINAVKEQQAQIEEMKKEIEELKKDKK